MSRLLIIFFILLLPLQFVWGAAARSCAHEKDEKISHFGHHAHVHKVAGSKTSVQDTLSGAQDLDCDYCHIGCVQPFPGQLPAGVMTPPSGFVPFDPFSTTFRLPRVIERPNWTLAT